MNHSTDSFVLHKTTLKCLQGGGWLYSKHRALVTPAGRGKCGKPKAMETEQADDQTPAEPVPPWPVFAPAKPAYMTSMAITWAQSLKRVFNIDVETCQACGGTLKVIACIEDPMVIQKILAHLDAKNLTATGAGLLPEPRAPPQASLFDSTFPVQMLFPKRMRQVFSRSSHRNWPGYGLHSPQTQQNSAAYPPYQDAYQSEASLSILWIQWNGRLYFLYAYDFTDIRITVFV